MTSGHKLKQKGLQGIREFEYSLGPEQGPWKLRHHSEKALAIQGPKHLDASGPETRMQMGAVTGEVWLLAGSLGWTIIRLQDKGRIQIPLHGQEQRRMRVDPSDPVGDDIEPGRADQVFFVEH